MNNFVLVERDKRKVEFLKTVIHELGLKNSQLYAGGVRELPAGEIKYCVSRAMSPLPKFLLENHKQMTKGGKAYLLKSDHWSTEFNAIHPQLFDFWEVDVKQPYILPKAQISRFVIQCTRV